MKETTVSLTNKEYSAPVILHEGMLEIQAGSPLSLLDAFDSEDME